MRFFTLMYIFLVLELNKLHCFAGFWSVLNYVKCATNLYECCNDKWVFYNITGLIRDLKSNVFGQHIVEQYVPAALAGQQMNPSKPLVMSFHGWPGGGKNYVTQFIANNMFKEGLHSKFYHYINGRTNFPLENKVNEYQNELRRLIIENVTLCDRSLFVIDEVDKMAPGVLDGVKPYLDYHPHIGGINYKNAVFIFLSNTGGTLITERYLELWRKYGKSREQMTLNDFDNIVGRGAFNEDGGLHFSDIIDHNLIDHYLPFLPLEKEHVAKCITTEVEKYGYLSSSDIVNEVMESVLFGPNPEKLFATSGCKRLSQKVTSLLQKRRLQREEL